MKRNNNLFNWKEIYLNNFLNNYTKFTQNQNEENYRELFNSSINLLKFFFATNGIIVQKERLIVIYAMKYNIFTDGLKFYNIYKALKNPVQKTLNNKFYGKKYLETFKEINNFFEKRIKMEDKN